MAVYQRCPNCKSAIAKDAQSQPGGILFCGTVITFDNYSEIVCKECKHHVRIEVVFLVPLAPPPPQPRPVLLPDQRHRMT